MCNFQKNLISIKKLLTISFAVVIVASMLTSCSVFHEKNPLYDVKFGHDLSWKLDKGVLTISGDGEIYDLDDFPWRHADYYYKDITSVVIEDGVTNIPHNAFQGCNHLETISIPASVTNIDCYIDSNYYREYIVDPDNKCYSSEDGVLFNKDKTTLIRAPRGLSGIYSVPDGVTTIEEGAFEYCTFVSNVVLPDSVTRIGSNAFADCLNLEGINIPDGVTNLPIGVCSSCRISSITIPDNVTSIESFAFRGCYNLKNADIGNNVTSIGDYAFSDCNNLTKVTIGESVNEIGKAAFQECESLQYIYYMGADRQWETIKISEENDYLLDANIYALERIK